MRSAITIILFGVILVAGFMISKSVLNSDPIVVTNFKQCVSAGYKVIDTTPRKCIAENDEIFSEEEDNKVVADIQVANYEECKEAGYEVIDSFPKECITPNGDSFVESVVMGAEQANSENLQRAQTYCKEQGGVVRVTYGDSGNVYYCEFTDGKKCEVEAYYSGECY